tara:strand:- start:3104 stop:3475 length:372 start_codon:yes stop_codon:yes gene_type:complete
MARQPQMNQRPEMPDMAGANMPRQQDASPVDETTIGAARQNIMKPSSQLASVLISRLGAMTEEQLAELDRAISPEAAKALLMLLPELGSILEALVQGGKVTPPEGARQAPQADPQMGALGGMS